MSNLSSDREILTAQILKDLHEHWQPHPAQQEILHSVFYGGKKDVYVECGRKFGKTETALYFLVRHALLYPNSANYYICPLLKQAKEVIWAKKRLQNFPPSKYIADINNTELRVTLTNGAFIKVEGSDNEHADRGIEPHSLVADEIAQHKRDYWDATMPNRLVFDGPMLVIGTPPQNENFATDLKNEFESDTKRGAYFNYPSSANPRISRERLEQIKARLMANGDEATWYREYEAKFVRSGKDQIFPMFDPLKHVLPHTKMMSRIKCDMHKMWWFVVADPGTTSCFAMLFGGINPFTKEIFIVDEIYETDQRYTSTNTIQPRMEKILDQYPGASRWTFTYDEAAAWFRSEMDFHTPARAWVPTSKTAMKRDPMTKEPWGLSIIKDALRYEKVFISEECKMLIKEISNYHRTFNRAGDVKILKKDDHLIDCFRYLIWESGYTLPERPEPGPKDPWKLPRRGYRLEEDLKNDAWYL